MLDLLNFVADEFKLTLLITTHQPEEALSLADHMLFLEEGKIIESGSPKSLLSAPDCPELRKYLGC